RWFWLNKRIFDIIISTLLVPLLILFSCILLVLNTIYNPGKLFFIQNRMGKNCKPFKAIKFRSMVPAKEITRKFDEPVETERILVLGKIIRKCRIDELPQIINVLKGEMSLIGPRPDYYVHALVYLKNVEGYRQRHDIRPGITGLSQIRNGYAEGLEATEKKANIDNYYIQNAGYFIDLKIILNTIIIIIKGYGK
ncbi:sugar transferase, partial [Amylibacter sp.]|nr:sugar transferase [Amylibacter sp.]